MDIDPDDHVQGAGIRDYDVIEVEDDGDDRGNLSIDSHYLLMWRLR